MKNTLRAKKAAEGLRIQQEAEAGKHQPQLWRTGEVNDFSDHGDGLEVVVGH